MKESVNFFLGSNTPQGFYSLFDELYNPYAGGRCYILKGGPGTGKSTFMKRVEESARNCGLETVRINCASDPSSLDAVIIKEKNVCIVDGTAPHVIEPQNPGICEQIIDLGEYWDSKILIKNAKSIERLNGEYKQCHARTVRFLKGAAVLEADTARLAEKHTDFKKLKTCADRIAKHETEKRHGETGECKKRFISVISPDGITLCSDTLYQLCNRIVGVEGVGNIPSILLNEIGERIRDRGHDIIKCPSFMQPEDETVCVIVPSKKIAFLRMDENTKNINTSRIIHTSRFTDNDAIMQYRSRIKFNKRLYGELIEQATDSLYNAKKLHDRLEEYYMSAMNFKKCEKRCDLVIREILK